MASALAYARLHCDKAASEKYNVSVRTLQRKRSSIEAGNELELAALVTDQKREATERCKDLLTHTHEQALRALCLRFDLSGEQRMTDRDLVGAIKILGSQRTQRDVFLEPENDDGRPAPGDSRGASAQGHAPQDPRRAEGAQSPAVH
jgi:hypothetical protein